MAKDLIHDAVRMALEKDGWTITHDPYFLDSTTREGRKVSLPIDLGAERLLGAERGADKIAVEIKSFLRASIINEFHKALGQYLLYKVGLRLQEPERQLFVAIPEKAMQQIEIVDLLLLSIEEYGMRVLIFEPKTGTIHTWKNQ